MNPAFIKERSVTRASLLALASFAGLACGSDPAVVALSVPTIDTLAGGIIRVVNTGPTMWQDTSGWRLVEERVIQPVEGSEGEFSDLTKLVADDAGNVYVMQINPTLIKAFDSTGNWVRNIGRGGNGPGEFPDGMLGIHGDTLIIQDPNNQRITTYLTSGTLVGIARSQCCNFTSSLPVFDDGTALVMGPPPEGVTTARSAFYRTRINGEVVDTLLRPVPAPRDRSSTMWSASQKIGPNTSTMDVGIPGLPRDLSAWRGDGLLVSGNTARYSLAVLRGYADTVRVFEADAPMLTRTDAERATMLEQAVGEQGPRWRDALRAVARIDQIPRNRPPWSALSTDRAHLIWVGLPGPAATVATLDVFSPDGVLLGTLPGPHPRILDGYWTRGRIFLIDSDSEGKPLVRVFRLVMTVE